MDRFIAACDHCVYRIWRFSDLRGPLDDHFWGQARFCSHPALQTLSSKNTMTGRTYRPFCCDVNKNGACQHYSSRSPDRLLSLLGYGLCCWLLWAVFNKLFQ
jgi:hypothetical protein